MNPDLKHITLFAFEQKLKELNIHFEYSDEIKKEAGLFLGAAEFYKMYALEVYTLCTESPALKNDPIIKQLLKIAKTIKGRGPLFSYAYKGNKSNVVMHRWDVLGPIDHYCSQSIDFILNALGFEPFKTRTRSSYCVLNFEVCNAPGGIKAINVQYPWAFGKIEFEDLDTHVIFCFLMKVNELLNDQEFYLYPKLLKVDYSDYM